MSTKEENNEHTYVHQILLWNMLWKSIDTLLLCF